MGFSENNTKRNVYSGKHLLKKKKDLKSTNLIFPFKELEKEEQTEPSFVSDKDLEQKINEIETRTIEHSQVLS